MHKNSHPNKVDLFNMEDRALLDLLECPLCFERLDVSTNVLSCQRTFCNCQPCLQRQEASHFQLRCPECRSPAQARSAEELPANLLLAQLLEGLQQQVVMGPGRGRLSSRHICENSMSREAQQQHRDRQGFSERASRALHNYRGDAQGELDTASGDVDALRQKVDENRTHGDTNDGRGTITFLQLPQSQPQSQSHSLQQSQPLALCRALYNFRIKEMDQDDCKDCLTFLKGDIITVIRRVDENWIEGRLGDKAGIFPLQFTEPNLAAAKLLQARNLKGIDLAEFHTSTTTRSGVNVKAIDLLNLTAHFGAPQAPTKIPTISSLPLPSQGKQPGISSSQYQMLPVQHSNVSTLNSLNQRQGQGEPSRLSGPPAPTGPGPSSGGTSQQGKHRTNSTHRHLSQGERKMSSETPPNITMALINPQMPTGSSDSKQSTQQLAISVCAALYSYKPRRPEELELRKGEMVGVYGKFKEGWLRGLSLRTGKVGILPINFVTPVLRTSARLLESKAASTASGTTSGKRATTSKNPAVVLALDRLNTDGAAYLPGQVPSAQNGAQHVMLSAGAGRHSLRGVSQGWDTVRRVFNSHRGSTQHVNHYAPSANSNFLPHSQNFAHVQASGYSPALQRKKHSSIHANPGRPLGWMSETTASSAGSFLKDRDTKTDAFDRHVSHGPHSILVKPDSHKNNTDKPTKSVRFLTEEDSSLPRARTSSWSSGCQASSTSGARGPPLEVWAPSLTLGRDGPGIVLKEGMAPVLRKGVETAVSDGGGASYHPKYVSVLSSAATANSSSPCRHRVATTYLAQMESERSLLQGEPVQVHKPRPDGRVLVTQEISGHTGLFNSNVLQFLERIS
ncbi:E3 ubiquitin-protein ligase SH3RF2 [Aplochiton taeniatus]